MGTIKIEFDLPEFKDNLELNLIIRRDGEVITNSSSSSTSGTFPKVGGPGSRVDHLPNMATPNREINKSDNSNIPKSMVEINI